MKIVSKDNNWLERVKQLEKKRKWIWLCAAVTFLAAYFHRTVTGVVADSLMRDFSIAQASELGILSSIYFYTYAAMQIPSGILADRYGPRLVISTSIVVAAFGAAIIGWSESLNSLYIGRFLASLGVSVVYVNVVKLQAEWFRMREFATMLGLLTLVGNGGSLLSATPLAVLVESAGWRSAFFLVAVYSLLMASLCWVVIRNHPKEEGLPSMAEVATQEFGGSMVSPVSPAKNNLMVGLVTVLRNRHTWTPFLASVAVFGVYMAISGIWAVPYFMQVLHMSRVEAANQVLLMFLGNMVGAPLVGYFSDRFGRRRCPYVVTTILFLAALICLTLGGTQIPLWLLSLLCFSFGIGVSGVSVAVVCAKEVNQPHLTGISAGIVNSAPFLGAALLQPAFGWVLDQFWQGTVELGVKIYTAEAYQNAFGMCAIVLLFGLGATLLIKETYGKQIKL
nr:MFS transporter [uncultured Anaeromusa sp.]